MAAIPKGSKKGESLDSPFHVPVLLQEAIKYLAVKKGEIYLDATVGGGGHAGEIVKKGGCLFGLDQDPQALAAAEKYLKSLPRESFTCPYPFFKRKDGANSFPWRLEKGNFKDLAAIAQKNGLKEVAGILFDLGASRKQLTSKERGFSFQSPRLDMRMDPDLGVTAADLLSVLSENELYQIFNQFSQEKLARPIARALVRAREIKPIKSGQELAALVEKIYRRYRRRGKIHPATKVFQALRIAVNSELDNLKEALPQALKLLKKGGRLVVISFHEGEDRIVKKFFKNKEKEGKLKILTKKIVVPQEGEKEKNPSARSARLRAAEKLN